MTCPVCGKELESLNPREKFCSPECYNAAKKLWRIKQLQRRQDRNVPFHILIRDAANQIKEAQHAHN